LCLVEDGVSYRVQALGELLLPVDGIASSAAGGPSNVIEQVNGGVAVYRRTGSLVQGPVTSAQWYGVPSSDQQFDPHTIFDPNGKRFITTMEDGTKKSWIVSVTTTSDATSSRCTYTIGALNSGATSVDFPLVGVSPKYLMLTIRENGGGNRLVVMTLAQVEACQGAGTWFWANVQNPGGGTADTLVPVLDYDTADNYSYLVNSYGAGGSHASLYKFSDSGSSPGVLISSIVSVPLYTQGYRQARRARRFSWNPATQTSRRPSITPMECTPR
jgi:hypothetical protein